MLQVIENVGKFAAKCVCRRCRELYLVNNKYDAKKSRIGDICEECKTAISNMGEITKEKLQAVYDYDERSGSLSHRRTTFTGNAKEIATRSHGCGYLYVHINKKRYFAHRIIYMYMTGCFPKQVDHINHIRDDNRWENLRDVGSRENSINTSLSKNSKTNVNGVCMHKPTGKYRAYIMVNRKHIHLGLFNSITEAKEARHKADVTYGFHGNHGR